MRTLEEKYDDLKWAYDNLLDKYHKLQEDKYKVDKELNSTECRIHNELEPRIKEEQRSYDTYVLSGGGDPCFQNGMSGNCGIECDAFGSKDECFDNKTDEQLIEAYENGCSEDKIKEIFLEQGKSNIVLRLLEDDLLDISSKISKFKSMEQQIYQERRKTVQDNCEHEFKDTGYGRTNESKIFEYEYMCKKCGLVEWRTNIN